MVCAKCGCEQDSAAQFCRECGTQMTASAPPPVSWVSATEYPMPPAVAFSRVRQHLQPLGITWLVFGAYRLLSLFIAATVLHTLSSSGLEFGGMGSHLGRVMHAFMPMLIATTVIFAGADLLTGYALLTRRPWARVLAIIMAILSLLRLPFGTALGIYTLWVLASRASGDEWGSVAGPAI